MAYVTTVDLPPMMMDKLRVMCRVPCEDELMNEGRKVFGHVFP